MGIWIPSLSAKLPAAGLRCSLLGAPSTNSACMLPSASMHACFHQRCMHSPISSMYAKHPDSSPNPSSSDSQGLCPFAALALLHTPKITLAPAMKSAAACRVGAGAQNFGLRRHPQSQYEQSSPRPHPQPSHTRSREDTQTLPSSENVKPCVIQ